MHSFVGPASYFIRSSVVVDDGRIYDWADAVCVAGLDEDGRFSCSAVTNGVYTLAAVWSVKGQAKSNTLVLPDIPQYCQARSGVAQYQH